MTARTSAIVLGVAVPLSLAAVWLWPRSQPRTLTLVSARFDLSARQTALFQFRHIRFCDGSPPLFASLSLSGTTERRDLPLECGQSTQLSVSGPKQGLTAVLAVTPAHGSWSPDALLQIVSRASSGEESVATLPLLPATRR